MTAYIEDRSEPPELCEGRPGPRSGMSAREIKALAVTVALIVCAILCFVFIGLPAGGMGGGCGGG